jgi:hypothetical protein
MPERRKYESDGAKIKLISGSRESGGIGDFSRVRCLLSGYGGRSFHLSLRDENVGVSRDFRWKACKSGTYSEVFGAKDLPVWS